MKNCQVLEVPKTSFMDYYSQMFKRYILQVMKTTSFQPFYTCGWALLHRRPGEKSLADFSNIMTLMLSL